MEAAAKIQSFRRRSPRGGRISGWCRVQHRALLVHLVGVVADLPRQREILQEIQALHRPLRVISGSTTTSCRVHLVTIPRITSAACSARDTNVTYARCTARRRRDTFPKFLESRGKPRSPGNRDLRGLTPPLPARNPESPNRLWWSHRSHHNSLWVACGKSGVSLGMTPLSLWRAAPRGCLRASCVVGAIGDPRGTKHANEFQDEKMTNVSGALKSSLEMAEGTKWH